MNSDFVPVPEGVAFQFPPMKTSIDPVVLCAIFDNVNFVCDKHNLDYNGRLDYLRTIFNLLICYEEGQDE